MNANKLSNPNFRRATTVVISSGLAVAALTGCSSNPESLRNVENYDLNERVTELTITDEARIRTSPNTGGSTDVDDQTLIVELDLKEPIIISTEEGVAIGTDFVEGDWYGIPVHELLENQDIAAQIPQNILDQAETGDPIVWINGQRAIPTWDTEPLS